MKLIFIIFYLILFNNAVLADLIKPNPGINHEEVIIIQLNALKDNNSPYINAGIAQTWEFAHPSNRKYTGPLENFTNMMYSSSYIIMLEHSNFNIIYVSSTNVQANYFVEMTDKIGNKFGFTWTLEKFLKEGNFKDCWMTISVSQPLPLAKTA